MLHMRQGRSLAQAPYIRREEPEVVGEVWADCASVPTVPYGQ